MIKIQNLTKKFDERPVLQAFNLEVKKNEFVTLAGPSGSGKTTILHLIGLLIEPDDGQVFINGKIINSEKAKMKMPRSVWIYFSKLCVDGQ